MSQPPAGGRAPRSLNRIWSTTSAAPRAESERAKLDSPRAGVMLKAGSRVPMLTMVAAQLRPAAVATNHEFVASVGGAICRFWLWLEGVTDMEDVFTTALTTRRARGRHALRATPLDVRAWTGRSAVSSATTTLRPHIATAGARKTRVSAVRISASRCRSAIALRVATIGPGITSLEPRNVGASSAASG